ncbi:MAG: family 78 glycoside hydrolase catalytic domain [Ginsengibacter sp.]
MKRHSIDFFQLFKYVLIAFLFTTINSNAQQARKTTQNKQGVSVESLQCENQINPIGIDIYNPRLSWISKARTVDRGQYQTAFRIQVASSKVLLQSGKPDLWDSGIVDGSHSNNLRYKGNKLSSNATYFWRVKVWDKNKKASNWSEVVFFETALLSNSEWKGKWIEDSKTISADEKDLYKDNPAPLFRREFKTPKTVKKAMMYVSGIGYYEAYINGKKVGNKLLDPGWTNYSKRILYSTYNVSSYLSAGANCLGVMLGNGWYNPLPLKMWGGKNIRDELTTGQPKFIMQLNIEYTDGTKEQIISDDKWKAASGPIIQNSIYLGEVYDARKEVPGWNRPGLNLNDWRPVKYATAPLGKLQSQQQPPIIAGKSLVPVKIIKKSDGRYIVDFGQNFGGIIRLEAKGKSGTTIHAKYGELLYPDGSLNVMTSTAGQIKRKGVGGIGAPDTAYAKDMFILNGKGTETFQTHFTFHGFRYVELSGYPGDLQKSNIKGLVLYSAVPDAGSFVCSDSLLNLIQQITLNTFRSNIFSVQSDCPQRERFGYGGDIVATCDAFMDNFDMAGFYEKTLNDFADEARPDGGITEIAPHVGIASDGLYGQAGPVEWGSVVPVLLNKLYQYYGDVSFIHQHYPVAKNWVDFMRRHAKNNLIDITIGDHESIDPQVVGLSATAFYYYNSTLLAGFAKTLNYQEDFIRYTALADTIKAAFISKYVDPITGKVDKHTVAAQAYALYFNLIPDHSKDAVLDVLLKAIDSNKTHITSGIFGTKFLMDVLSRTGNTDIAFKMATQKTFPGWGYMIANGATTLWEHWAFSDNTFSHNHPMFGSISDWFYKNLAGIRPAEDAVGFNKIIVQPQIANLTWAKASYNSVLGKVSSSWKKVGNTFTLDISIPVNATASVYLPDILQDIREGGSPINKGQVTIIGKQKNESMFEIGSGDYHFSATLQTK